MNLKFANDSVFVYKNRIYVSLLRRSCKSTRNLKYILKKFILMEFVKISIFMFMFTLQNRIWKAFCNMFKWTLFYKEPNCFIYRLKAHYQIWDSFDKLKALFKMMKNSFYFTLKAPFTLKIFKFLSRLFGQR